MLNSYSVFKAIFFRQIKICKYNAVYIIYPITYLVLTLVVFKIAIHHHDQAQNLSYSVFFSVNIIALSCSNPLLIENDYNSGILEQFYLTGCDLSVIILAKYLCHYLVCFLTSILVTVVSLLFLNIPFDNIYYIFTIIMLINAIILISMIFANSLLIGTQSSMLLSITVLVLIIPAIIFAILSLENTAYMGLLFALFLLLLPILTLCSKQLILVAFEDKS